MDKAIIFSHFFQKVVISPSELEANDSTNLLIVKVLDNSIKPF